MPKPIYALLCDYGIYDEWRNRHSAIGLFNHFSASSFPAIFRFDVVSKWRAGEQEVQGEFMIRVAPIAGRFGVSGIVAATAPKQLTFDPFTHTAANTAHFDIQLPIEGEYQLEFYFNNNLVHALPFFVIPDD